MILRGYSDSVEDVDVEALTFDGWETVTDPGFWPAHLGDLVEDDVLAEAWRIDTAAVRAAYSRLNSWTAWPVFPVDLGGGAQLAVVYRSYRPDAGVDYLVIPGDGADCIRIAAIEGHQLGPGISWAELTGLADRQSDPVQGARVLLLFAPILGDEEAEGEEAAVRLAEALRLLGATGDLDEVIEGLVTENPYYDPVAWTLTSEGVRVCEDETSPRDPRSPVALQPAELRLVSDLLNTHR